MSNLWYLEPDYKKKWSQVSYLRIKINKPGSDRVISVNATLDTEPFFGFMGQLGRDVLDELQISEGEIFRGFDEQEGEVEVRTTSAVLSLKQIQIQAPVIMQLNGNATILFGDFLKRIPADLPLSDVSIPNFSRIGGIARDEMKRVFLSHSHKDRKFAHNLARSLRRRGIYVWVDEAEINIGDSLIEKLRQAIDEVDFVVAVVSLASIKSGWVQKELDIAMNQEIKTRRIKVLPIMIENCDLPGFLEGKLFGDFRDRSGRTRSFQKLVRSILYL